MTLNHICAKFPKDAGVCLKAAPVFYWSVPVSPDYPKSLHGSPSRLFYFPKPGRWSMKMPEKTSFASYLTGAVLVLVGKLGNLLKDLTLNDWAIVIGIIIGVATFFLNAYWQRRQTKAIEKAAREGYTIIRGDK
ncbi:TPA: HP1 family phage holin [Yersinia enterocolitica]